MTLEGIMKNLGTCNKIMLNANSHPSINMISERTFYVQPNYHELNESKTNSKFIIFSAAGATGKSALAKYLASTKGGVYWDLSKIRLGENSFYGTLGNAIGFENIKNFFEDLNNGTALLVIDAFDEADIISGRTAIEFLLGDLNNITKESHYPTVVLLSRTETAAFIANFCKKITLVIHIMRLVFLLNIMQSNLLLIN